MKYLLNCLHCGTSIIATERVSDAEVAAVELTMPTCSRRIASTSRNFWDTSA